MLQQLIVKKPLSLSVLVLVIVIFAFFAHSIHFTMGSSEKLVAVNFEVYGVVQG